MKDCDLIAEVRAKSAREDWRQCDFGHEHHGSAALKQSGAHGAYVDFCLAAARNAMKQERAVAAFSERLLNLFESRSLRFRQLNIFYLRPRRRCERIAPDVSDEDLYDATLLKSLNR